MAAPAGKASVKYVPYTRFTGARSFISFQVYPGPDRTRKPGPKVARTS
jgi:hypothetical protein